MVGRSMHESIEYKKSVEKERPILTAEPKIIAIDGIDGAGKTTLAKILSKKIAVRFGREVAVLKFNLSGGPKQKNLADI
ncbi:MAG: hypothetical protein Q8L21_02255, partial [Candidatus Komeilibacteria bacterium]|nr:hypothetical protein [Candidatus Komeilibacteria bacterium]